MPTSRTLPSGCRPHPASWLRDGTSLSGVRAPQVPRGALLGWRRYHLNQFVGTEEVWLPEGDWTSCRVGDPDPTGGVTFEYATIHELADVAATIVPAVEEARDANLVAVEDRYDIVLAGHHPQVPPEMIMLDGLAVYDVVRVAPTLGRRATVLVAQRVAL